MAYKKIRDMKSLMSIRSSKKDRVDNIYIDIATGDVLYYIPSDMFFRIEDTIKAGIEDEVDYGWRN